ncbi:MAG: hypothetical protein L0Z50_01890 [Verrucomicrobiales bacterium]|nr:hypothetical protein [Verrucomicrobiales bacterium]
MTVLIDGQAMLLRWMGGRRRAMAVREGAKTSTNTVENVPLPGGFEPLHTDAITTWSIAPDGQRIATGARDRTVRISDLQTRRPLVNPLLHGDIVNSVRFSPDGLRLVTSAANGEIRVWDSHTGQPLMDWLVSWTDFDSVAFSEDGSTIITSSGGRFPIALVDGLVPAWLAKATVAAVGIRLNEWNVFETVSPAEAVRMLNSVRDLDLSAPLPTWVRELLGGAR